MTITICTSKKFKDLIPKVAKKLELHGNIVFIPFFYMDGSLKSKFVSNFKKIRQSDQIYVINPNGYIGESVSAEIAFAMIENKEIKYLTEDNDMLEYLDTIDRGKE